MRPFHTLGRLDVDAAVNGTRPAHHQRKSSLNEDVYRSQQTPGRTPQAQDGFMEVPASKLQRLSGVSERYLGLEKYENMFSKFGFWMLGLTAVSVTLLVVAIIFLSWIWFSDRDQDLWRLLMLGDYNSRSITLTGVGIRYAIACLGWITVAMMASVVVEMYGVPADKIAQASIARYTGSLLPLMFGGFALRRWFRILIPMQLGCAIYAQFTSTLLFSDFDTSLISGFTESHAVNYDFAATKPGNDESGGQMRRDLVTMPVNEFVFGGYRTIPTEFQTFAELAEPEARSMRAGVDDTGPSIRAFVPIGDKAMREGVQTYKGMTRVIDSRVVCVRPNITELGYKRLGAPFDLNLVNVTRDQRETSNTVILSGVATINTDLIPEVMDPGRTLTIYFDCHLTTTPGHTAVDRGQTVVDDPPDMDAHFWQQCDTFQEELQPYPRLVPQTDPLYWNRDRIAELGSEAFIDVLVRPDGSASGEIVPATGTLASIREYRLGSSYMLADTFNPSRWRFPANTSGTEFPMDATLPLMGQTFDGPWSVVRSVVPADQTINMPEFDVNFTRLRRDIDINFQSTFCLDAVMPELGMFKHVDLEVTGTRDRAPEPTPTYEQDRKAYNVSAVARQLGATMQAHTHAERGVLSITPSSWERLVDETLRPAPLDAFDQEFGDLSSYMFGERGGDKAITFCERCNNVLPTFDTTSRYWESLFAGIMAETGRPALAVQAANTERARIAYMAAVNAYNVGDRASVTLFEAAQVPVRALGFAAVMGLIAVQIGLVLVAGFLFHRTRHSLLNNAWHVLAQVSTSAEAAHLLPKARTMTDMDVHRYALSEDGEKILGSPVDAGDGPVRYVLDGGSFKPQVVKTTGWENFRWRPVRKASSPLRKWEASSA